MLLRTASILLFAAALAGCGAMPMHQRQDDAQWAATAPVEQTSPPPPDGSIYHDMQNMELFNDSRAHRIGDILTINLVEAMQASKKSETTTSKADKVNVGAPQVLGQSLRVLGKSADSTLNSANSFDGAGSSTQSNQLSGQLTVTVAQRLSVLHGINAPEFFDKAVFSTLVLTLRDEGYISDTGDAEPAETMKVYQMLAELMTSDVRLTIESAAAQASA